MSITEQGRQGETWARGWLKARGLEIFQPDWIARDPIGQRYVVEVKHQERFEPPPFEGHGLPPYQVEARLDFQRATQVRALLLVREPSGGVFWQFLDELERGTKFDTNGASIRRIYPLESFRTDS